MSKILLVDDEANALNGLKVLIDFEKYDIDTIFTAKNAFDALAIIEESRPEYIITDISMPQMTGLQMITEIKKVAKYTPKIIVLSGFSTFQYAKEALALGVRAYLLKPCDEDELDDILTKLHAEPDEDKEETASAVAESFMLKILNGENAQKAYLAIESFMEYKPGESLCIFPCKVAFKNSKEVDLTEEEIENSNAKFVEIMTKMLTAEGKVAAFSLSSSEILFVLHAQIISTESLSQKIKNTQDLAFSGHGIISSAILSDSFIRIDEIAKVFGECKNSLLHTSGLTKPQLSMLADETISSDEFKTIYNLFNELSANFETIYQDELTEKIDTIFAMAKQIDMPVAYFWSIYNAFIINITRYVAELDRDVDKIIDKLADIKSKQSQTLLQENSPLKDLVIELYTEMNTHKIHQQNEVFHNIITYVTNNYSENLTLKSLSTKFYVNPIYLGRLFKKNTGTLFNEYLTNIRIEKSKVLLLKTNKKIYEIADEIGFNDPNYFIAKFLKAEGTTPSQYRKKQV
ncbi:MAG: response regulator [Bacillota bacterium]